MRPRSVTTFLLVPSFVVPVVLAACVTDTPVNRSASDSGVPTSTAPTSTSLSDGAPPPVADGGGGADASTTCPAGFAECDGDPKTTCETDTRTSAAHCGACDRACGGTSTCQASDCQSEKLADGLNRPFGLAVAGARLLWHEPDVVRGCRADDCNTSKAVMADVMGTLTNQPTGNISARQIYVEGQSFYFSQCVSGSQNSCGVASCDIGGCKLTGTKFVAAVNENRRAAWITGANGMVFSHQGLDGLYRTDIAAKTVTYESKKYGVGDQVQSAYLVPQHFVYADDNASQANPVGGVFVCPATGCTAEPTRLLPPPVKTLFVTGTTAYVSSGGAAAATGSVTACNVTGCGGAGTLLATNQAYVSDIAADAKAVYWSTVGAASVETNATAVGTIMRCAKPCTGGPQKIADAQVNPVSVVIDNTYVYWLARGTTNGNNGSLWRKRR